jgi:F0F1-type ATP synthase assembly protein I
MDNSAKEQERSFLRSLARYSQVGLALPAATVAGYLLGLLADHFFHTTWLYFVGLLLGIVAGFVELIRTALSVSNEEQGGSEPKKDEPGKGR